MSQHIEIIARAAILCGEHALLCRHFPGKYLVLPGGHVEFGEPAAVALAREIREEIGVDLRVGQCLAIQEQLFRQKSKDRHEINLMFHVEHPYGWDPSSPPHLVSPEAPNLELVWVHRAKIAASDIRPTKAAEILTGLFAHRSEGGHTQTAWIPQSGL